MSELLHGAEKYGNRQKRVTMVQTLLAPFQCLPFDDIDATHYASLRHDLEVRGEVIGPYDLLIAMTSSSQSTNVGVFGQLVEFARRRLGLSLEGLAQKADVDLRSLVLLERTGEVVLSTKAIGRLAETLGLPVKGLTEVAGIDDQRSEKIEEAMYYFAARAEPNSRLSEAEEYAFNELVKVISEQ